MKISKEKITVLAGGVAGGLLLGGAIAGATRSFPITKEFRETENTMNGRTPTLYVSARFRHCYLQYTVTENGVQIENFQVRMQGLNMMWLDEIQGKPTQLAFVRANDQVIQNGHVRTGSFSDLLKARDFYASLCYDVRYRGKNDSWIVPPAVDNAPAPSG